MLLDYTLIRLCEHHSGVDAKVSNSRKLLASYALNVY